ncbi:MAG: hypothetical protein U9R58_03625 [Chloroflexota bacterium]|nr:hypothetical protein [Chloroflexota bacterium]
MLGKITLKVKSSACFIIAVLLIPVITPNSDFRLVTEIHIRPKRYLQTDDCDQLINQLKRNPAWLDELYNPVLTSPDQLEEQISIYTPIFECLNRLEAPLTAEQELILRLSTLFLIFADGLDTPTQGADLHLVDLGDVNDPAVNRLRNLLDLPPPEGYVFLRTYATTAAMPPLIRQIFEQRNVAGVTILSRYIAVLDEEGQTWTDSALQAQTLPRTISHELVHAYVNSTLGPEQIGNMPTWFHEGVAIYFSRSGENQAIVTPNFTLYTTPPPDYRQYDLNFKFLEANLGEERLLTLIQHSIQKSDASIVLDALNIKNQAELEQLSLNWQAAQIRNRSVLALIVILLFSGLLMSGSLQYVGLARPYERCQICGRRFWFGRKTQLRHQIPATRIWLNGSSKIEDTYSVYAHYVCETCLANSQKVLETYKDQKNLQLAQARNEAIATYREWLTHAPISDAHADQDTEYLTFHQAVELLSEVALSYTFSPPWHNVDQDLEFPHIQADNSLDPITSPPPGYNQIFQKTTFSQGKKRRYLGSLKVNEHDLYMIIWSD